MTMRSLPETKRLSTADIEHMADTAGQAARRIEALVPLIVRAIATPRSMAEDKIVRAVTSMKAVVRA